MSNVVPETGAVASDAGSSDGATDPDPVPGDVNPNDGSGSTPPEAIPYARFKEVNDQLRSYKELEKLGYDVDSLRQLATWEQQFSQDPVTNWLSVARNLEGLPEVVVMALKDYFDEPYTEEEDDSEGEEEEQEQDPEVRATVEWAKAKQAEEVQQHRMKLLNEIMEDWAKQNRNEKLEVLSENVMLTFIAGAAGTGSTKEEILKNARETWLEARNLALSTVVRPGRGVPVPASGGAAPTGSGPIRAKDFNEANALARAALEKGLLGG